MSVLVEINNDQPTKKFIVHGFLRQPLHHTVAVWQILIYCSNEKLRFLRI